MEILKTIVAIVLTPLFSLATWSGVLPEQQIAQPSPIVIQEQVEDQFSQLLGAYNVTGGGTYRLKSSSASTDSTLNLSSFKEPVSDIPYSMSQLNTTISYGTIEPQTTRTEFVSFTGITQNSDGSATLTGVTRGLTRTPAGVSCTASTTLAQRHSAQSIFILSDSPCHFAEYPVKRNDETITGTWLGPTPTQASQFAIKSYVDGLVNGGTVSTDRVQVAATAGESFATGTVVYLNITDAEWYKADADAVGTTQNILIGLAQGSGTDGVQINGGVNLFGLDSSQASLTPGQKLYLSGTAGATSTVPGTHYRALGISRSSTSFYLNPFMDVSTTTNATTTNLYVSGTSTVGFLNVASLGKNVQVCTANCTWTKITGTTKIKLTMVAGGGSGAGPAAGSTDTGGGGAGGFCLKWIDVTGTSTINALVGSGGATTTSNNDGNTGGSSVFSSFASTTGGAGGKRASGGGLGGNSFGCDINITGENGGAGQVLGYSSTTPTGKGGSTSFGQGGQAIIKEATEGFAGGGYGAGGSGGKPNSGNGAAGGKGADGLIIIEW